VRDVIQLSGDVQRFDNSKFLSVYLQRAYLPPGRQGLFPLAEAGDTPGMEPSEQVPCSRRVSLRCRARRRSALILNSAPRGI
jgi:hypothetical protein